MATAKKTPAKKATTVKKKAPAKKAPVKKSASKKVSKSKAAQVTSFKVAPNVPSFRTFKITRQTFYWIIIISLIIFFQLWILRLQIEVSTLIEIQRTAIEESL